MREGVTVCQGGVGQRFGALALKAPTSLTASARSSSEVDLSWHDTNSQENGYLIERSLASTSGFAQIATVPTNVHSYKDLGLAQSTTYYYRLRASDSTGLFSAYSSVASATTSADTTAPSTPSGLQASASACGQTSLGWSASTDGGSGVAAYNVYRGGVLLKQVLAPATSTTDSGLLPSTTYSYAVSAVDRAGNESTKSGSVKVTTLACMATTTTSTTTTTTLVTLTGGCSSPTVIPAQGGTFSGATSGSSSLAGSCGSSGGSPERVFQWTPAVSGTATIQTCGAGTTFDTVLYVRGGACASGSEVVSGCNDDACADANGLNRASRVTPMVTAGQTYFIVVDGYGGAQGNFSLTVTPPGVSTTTTLPAVTTTTVFTTTTTTRPPTATTSTTIFATTTTLPPPTNLTATAPSCSEIDLRWTLSTGTVSGYNVYRKASTATTFTLVQQVGAAPVFPVADTAAGAATTYTYGVTAWNSASTSTMPTVLTNTPGCPVTVDPTLAGFVPGVGTPTDLVLDGATGLAYVASYEFGLSVVDVRNPRGPVAIGAANPPFNGTRIAVAAPLAVVGQGSGNGFKVVDVSVPAAPKTVGGLSTGTVQGVAMAGHFAYVLFIVPGNPSHAELDVVDLTVPSTPTIVGRLAFAGGGGGVAVVGSVAYVASGGLQVVDVSSPTAPRLLGSAPTTTGSQGVAVANGNAYLADTSATRIINVATPSRPVIVSSITSVNAQAVAVTGTRLYVLDGGLLKLFDVSTAAVPVLLGAGTSVPGGSLHVAAVGTVAYLANPDVVYTGSSPQGGLYVLDFSVPASPGMLANVRVTYDDRAVAAAGSLAAAGGMGKLTFLDISVPSTPRALSALSGTAQGVAMAGQFAYPLFIVPGNPAHAELDVVNLTVSSSPAIVGRLAFAGGGGGVAVAGSLAYVAASGLQVVDVSSPTAPRVVGSLPTATGSQGVAVANGYAYLADTSATRIIDVSTPSRPA
ncbi:MAG: hypothetical protein E6G17_11945, partial [Actinobacteria bacterium]